MQMTRIILTVCCMAASLFAVGQREYDPHFYLGARAGMTFSQMEFSPGVEQSMLSGFTAGITARYVEEKYFGIIAELNFDQRGWKEFYEDTDFKYERRLTYIELPVLTHLYFGKRNFKGFLNLGPYVGYMISSSITSNFNYHDTESVEGFPPDRHVNQMSMDVKHKFDYGILAGLGCELRVKGRHSINIEARYYYGLGNIFPAAKKDEFSASRGSSIQVALGYYFQLK